MTDGHTRDDIEVIAAGLALGLLDGHERAEALRRQLVDHKFAARVNAWQNTGDRWLEGVEPVSAPAKTRASIEAQLDRRSVDRSASPIANDSGSTRVWRTLALGTVAASLVLSVGLGITLLNPAQRTGDGGSATSIRPLQLANVAQIKDAAGAPLLSALYDPASGSLSLRLADLQQPEFGPELWIIPQDGVPRSLGLIDGERLTVTLSPELRSFLQDGATMAITIEPREGAPHRAPTGDILGTAVLQEIPIGDT